MRDWRSIRIKAAKHEKQWGQNDAVTLRTDRMGYGRRRRYRARHMNAVNAVRGQGASQGGNGRSSSRLSSPEREDLRTRLRKARKMRENSKERTGAIKEWTKDLLRLTNGDANELLDILREAEREGPGDPDDDYFSDDNIAEAFARNDRSGDSRGRDTGERKTASPGRSASVSPTQNRRGRLRPRRGDDMPKLPTKVLADGRVVIDRTPRYGTNYNLGQNYVDGTMYRSRTDDIYARNGPRVPARCRAATENETLSTEIFVSSKNFSAPAGKISQYTVPKISLSQARKRQYRSDNSERCRCWKDGDRRRQSRFPRNNHNNTFGKRRQGGGGGGGAENRVLDMLREAIQKKRMLYGHTLADTRAIFVAMDKDSSGSIDEGELSFALQRLGIFATETQVEDLMLQLDTDGDGLIDYEELVAAIHSNSISMEQQPEWQRSPRANNLTTSPRQRKQALPPPTSFGLPPLKSRYLPATLTGPLFTQTQYTSAKSLQNYHGEVTTIPASVGTHAKDAGLQRTELQVRLAGAGIGVMKPLMVVLEVGFRNPTSKKPLTDMERKQLDIVSRFFTEGARQRPIAWLDGSNHTFTGKAAVDWLVDVGKEATNETEAVGILQGNVEQWHYNKD